MNAKSHYLFSYLIIIITALTFACSRTTSINPKYDAVSDEYSKLSEQYLMHISNFEWDKSFTYLAENVEFKLPDGDTDSRTTFKGIEKVKEFWNHYSHNSGNNKAVFKDFVHVPVKVNQMIEHVGTTGVFDLSYFSAELSYGAAKANVRMHWALHFNANKKIDGIYAYYDRTPIIQAAKLNFLASSNAVSERDKVVQFIKIKSPLSEEELMQTAIERAEKFKELPGLIQKYYVRLNQPGEYGGVYIWNSKEALQAFKTSELAAGIAQAYQITESPNVEIGSILFQLR